MTGQPPVPPSRRERTRRRLAIAVLAVVVIGGVAVWWFRPWAEVADVGDVDELADGLEDSTLAHETEVVTPAGTYVVRLGDPVDSLAVDELAVADELDPQARTATVDEAIYAPRGSSFWPVEWQPAGGAPPTAAEVYAPRRVALDGEPPTLAVAVGGEVVAGPYPLDGTHPPEADVPAELAVAVAAEAGDVTVEVTFDGVTQVVDAASGEVDAGLASAYYDGAGDDGERGRCRWEGDLPRGVRFGQLDCDVLGATASPWDPERGWVAEPGQTWASVELRVGAFGQLQVGDSADYLDTGGRISGPTLVDGTTPDRLRPTSDGRLGSFGQEVVATWLLDEPTDRVEVRLEGTLRLTPAFDPESDEPTGRAPVTAVLDVPLTGSSTSG